MRPLALDELDDDLKYDDELKSGKSLVDDIDDGINSEYGGAGVEVTAQSSEKQFRVIPEED